ncbi:sensor histidine kinase [Virgibacillus dokdonensis]|uniref:histidine kinase n=2 Tax=Virgibacillus dokdonensis TaxID=302167 RepID=A0A2K9IY61_9BACI|nr:HAMP domain-containing sensor histidine kinase [Virgibacillus dokdonensis]AUJ24662.1 Signal transduction histidine-protein kinase BaeS [Virgibacillus dokdonensis]
MFYKKVYLITLISILFFPFAFIVSNYTVYGIHVLYNFMSGTDTPFKSDENYIYIFSLFFILILLYVYFLSKTLKNISLEITNLSKLIRDIAEEQDISDFVSISSLKFDEIRYLSESINILIEKLQYNQKKYNESEEIRKKYLDQLSHDIKTPLSIININLYYIQTGKNINKAIEEITKNVNIISTLSDRIYHKNYLNSDSIIIKKEPVVLTDFLHQILQKWNNAFNHKQIQCNMNIDSSIIWVLDKIWFERLFDNILQNVLYHSKASAVEIKAMKEKKYERLIIVDNGIGFDYPEKDLSNGKGLTIIKEIPSLLELGISINSDKFGTRITLTHNI